ncbi:MAG: phage tail tube protein [Berryella intestinalis]|uniref:phage tail tube protein n=1 Tax=Berryella intestinalis TaxID=1531429 RepID=UPI002A74EFF6|nr:phage tail tube protein [Berryella intestinalis]MDY3129286.1 phage tail tube protein [Berryella intestinalis]
MSVNTSIGLIGVAKQADKATPAPAPAFVHGLTGGQTFKLDRSVESANVSCGIRAGTDSYVSSVTPGVDFETYGYSDVLPLYIYAAMGNIVSSSNDSGASYKHVVTLGDLLPYLTFWGRIGGEYTRTDGCKVDQIEMDFEGNKPLGFGITAIGLDAELGLAKFPGEIDPSCFDGYYVPTGGVFKVETAGSSPVVAPVTKGSLSLSNSCAADPLAGMVTPADVAEGKLSTSGSVTVKPDDMALYRKMITGSASGKKPTGGMVYGSFDWEFTHSKNPKHKMTVSASRVPFTCDFPSVDPEGGAAELDFSFENVGVDSRGGSPVTFTFENDTASYVG